MMWRPCSAATRPATSSRQRFEQMLIRGIGQGQARLGDVLVEPFDQFPAGAQGARLVTRHLEFVLFDHHDDPRRQGCYQFGLELAAVFARRRSSEPAG
jgi:hypothetical protein